jgi:hypothetical protein
MPKITSLKLSSVDKQILKFLLTADRKVRSKFIADKLRVPQSTIQRRRERLELNFLEANYSLNVTKFGWRRVDFFISTRNGMTDEVAKKLLEERNIVYVGKSIGEHTIDLRAEAIIKDNGDLLVMLEKIKAIKGVQDAIWSEIVKVVGRKKSIPNEIIESL